MKLFWTALLVVFLVSFASPYLYAENGSTTIIWGAVGHNDHSPKDTSYSYNAVPLTQQVNLMKRAGMKAYRAGCDDKTCPQLIEMLSKNDMFLLRSIELRPDQNATDYENYMRGFKYAFKEASKYREKIQYYEASNELDNWSKPSYDGADRQQYNPARYAQAKAFIKGLIDGIHKADPYAKVLVDNGGWCHYGFLKELWEDGVRWDITAFHWYSDHGNVEKAGCRNANIAEIHTSFGKPVWITEFNKRSYSDYDDSEAAAKWITNFMQQITAIAPKYNIQAAFVYELLDQDNRTDGEQFYGIADSTGEPKAQWHAIKQLLIKTESASSPH